MRPRRFAKVQLGRTSTHKCSLAELGVDEERKSESKFFKPYDTGKYIKYYHKKFLCIDLDEIYIYGDFHTDFTR